MDTCQGRDRAGSAEHMNIARGDRAIERVGFGKGSQHFADFTDHGLEQIRCDVTPAVAFTGVNDADGQRHPTTDAIGHASASSTASGRQVDPHQLGRAATDIEQNDAAGAWIDQRGAARYGETSLGLARNHFKGQAGFPPDPVYKLLSICSHPARFGRDQTGADNVAAVEFGCGTLSRPR